MPIELHLEARGNSRVTMGSKHVIIRIPKRKAASESRKQLDWALEWVRNSLEQNEQWLYQFKPLRFGIEEDLFLWDRPVQIKIQHQDRASYSARFTDNEIRVLCPVIKRNSIFNQKLRIILHKAIAKMFDTQFSNRVDEINRSTFNYNYQSVQVKYVLSKWGSCDSKKRLVFSSKLLLCPAWVRDYIIVHELAHLKEMNHSAKFWALVARVMPDYKRAEKWLNTTGKSIDF